MPGPWENYAPASSAPPPPGPWSNYTSSAGSDDDKPSIASDAAKYSPVGMVQGLAGMIRTAASGKNPFAGMAEANEKHLEAAKDSYGKGHYAEAAGHFLNYLSPIGGAAEDISGDLQNGDYGHAAAKFAGLASNAALPGALDAATSPEVAAGVRKLPGALAEGAKAGTPDVAAGAAKIVGGEVLAKVPGMSLPARWGIQRPGMYQALNGLKKGTKAFSDALSGQVAEAATTAEAEGTPGSMLDQVAQSQTGKPWTKLSFDEQNAIRTLASKLQPSDSPAPAPKAAQAPAPVQPGQPLAMANSGAPAAQLPAPGPAPIVTAAPEDASFVKAVPAQYAKPIPQNATPAQLGKFPAGQVAQWLAERNGNFGPYDTPAGNELVPDKPAPAPAKSTAEQLRDELLKNGMPAEMAEPGSDVIDKSALRDLMRGQPAGVPKAIAKANYAGDQEPEMAGAVYEAAARADKATKLANALHTHGITSDLAQHMTPEDWQTISKPLGVNVPSKASIGEALFRLQQLEATKPPGGIQ